MSEDNRNLFGESVAMPGEPKGKPKPPASNVVPFGKYKGQPVEAMAADAGYMEWLSGQAWFRDKYENIYTLIINNFAEPSETPAHNALQVLFLDDDYAWRVAHYAENKEIWRKISYEGQSDIIGMAIKSVRFEVSGIDVIINMMARFERYVFNPVTEQYIKGFWIRSIPIHYAVAIKPAVGDDYPAVLRQMRNLRPDAWLRGKILFLEQYTGTGATREQFIETFRRSGIAVVFRDEV